jgi:hypothetical protein
MATKSSTKTSGAMMALIVVLVLLALGGATVGTLMATGVIGKKAAPKSGPGPALPPRSAYSTGGSSGASAQASSVNLGQVRYPSQLNTNNGPSNPTYGGLHSKHDASMASAAQSAGCASTLPMGYYPFSQNVAAAYDRQFPDSQDPSSLQKGTNATPRQQEFCGGGGSAAASKGFLDMNTLMPQNWRSEGDVGSGCSGDASTLGAQTWAKFAPTKAAFNQYITAAGSARLGVNTRIKTPGGVRSLLRGGAPVPITASEIIFQDSSFRQDLLQNATGIYPTLGMC